MNHGAEGKEPLSPSRQSLGAGDPPPSAADTGGAGRIGPTQGAPLFPLLCVNPARGPPNRTCPRRSAMLPNRDAPEPQWSMMLPNRDAPKPPLCSDTGKGEGSTTGCQCESSCTHFIHLMFD